MIYQKEESHLDTKFQRNLKIIILENKVRPSGFTGHLNI